MGAVHAAECERAHIWVSLGLDGELSEVEQASLRAHVGRCAACAGFTRDVEALTRKLRTAPLERPVVAGMRRRRRSAGLRALQLGAAAAAIALAAGLGSLAGSLHSNPGPASPAATTGAQHPAGGGLALAPGQRLQARPIAL